MMHNDHNIVARISCRASLPEVQVHWADDAFAIYTTISRVRRQSLHMQSSRYTLQVQLHSTSSTYHSLQPMHGLDPHYDDLYLYG